jgi:hypothetical protein
MSPRPRNILWPPEGFGKQGAGELEPVPAGWDRGKWFELVDDLAALAERARLGDDVDDLVELVWHLAEADEVLAASGYSNLVAEVAAVAEAHQPPGGEYGQTAWNEKTRTVFWVAADWTSDRQLSDTKAAFFAVAGVVAVDTCAECALPAGDDWVEVWPGVDARLAEQAETDVALRAEADELEEWAARTRTRRRREPLQYFEEVGDGITLVHSLTASGASRRTRIEGSPFAHWRRDKSSSTRRTHAPYRGGRGVRVDPRRRRVLTASGAPLESVTRNGRTFRPIVKADGSVSLV